jgi:NitT/TauT family transport system substrate-binding protein
MKWRTTRRASALGAMAALAALSAGCGSSSSSSAPSSGGLPSVTSVRMQLSWLPSSQFAGYLVAKAKGFYRAAGLNVTILPGGPNVNDVQSLVSGQADVTVDRTSTLFASIDKGIPIKAIAEFDHESGFWLIAKKSTGITKPADLRGKRIGIFSDDVFEYDAMLSKMGLNPKTDVKTFYEGFTMTPWINNQYPVAMVTSWDELQSVYEAGIKPSQLTFFKPTSYGVGILHGCLIATDQMISSHPAALKAFVAATIKGWRYAYAHPSEAVAIVLKAAGPNDSARHETDQLQAMKSIQWVNGQEPMNWGTIPVGVYKTDATEVEHATPKIVTKPINVSSAVDLSIAGH